VAGNTRFIYLGNDRVLEWSYSTGDYSIWIYDRSVRGQADPFKGPEVYGKWDSIKIEQMHDHHDVNLVYMGNDRLLEWHDNDGKYWFWGYDRSVRGNNDPIPYYGAWGTWSSITDDGNHQLFYLGEYQAGIGFWSGTIRTVLDLDQHGNYRYYCYDGVLASKTGNSDPLHPLITSGKWSSIKTYGNGEQDKLIYLGNDRVLVWDMSDGDYRIYVIDRGASDGEDLLPGEPEVWGTWKNLYRDHP